MSYNNLLLHSHFVSDTAAEKKSNVTCPVTLSGSAHVHPNSDEDYYNDSSSEDSCGPVEVFYDQHTEMLAWEQLERHKWHDETTAGTSSNCSKLQPTTTATSEQRKTRTSKARENVKGDCSIGNAILLPPLCNSANNTAPHGRGLSRSVTAHAKGASVSRPKRSTGRPVVRQYAGIVNAAVATMDHAVSIPFALRCAARRTMYDVLIDIERRKKTEQRTKEEKERACGGSSSTAHPSPGVCSARQQKPPTPLATALSAHDKTYRTLFPSTAATFVATCATGHATGFRVSRPQQNRAAGDMIAEPFERHNTTFLLQGMSRGSHSTLATTTAESSPRESRNAVTSNTVTALASTTKLPSLLSPTAGAVASPRREDGPDRRLRHLLPAHLHGPRLTPSNGGASVDGMESSYVQEAGLEDARDDDSISDISSVSSSVRRGHHKSQQSVGYASAESLKPSTTEKDVSLLNFLDEGRMKEGKQNSSPPAHEPTKNKVTSKEDGKDWLQRLEEASRVLQLRGQQQQQQRQGTKEGRLSTVAVGDCLLEDVLMGYSSGQRTSQVPQKRKHRHKHRYHRYDNGGNTNSEGNGGIGSRGTSDEGSKTAAPASASVYHGSNSNSATSSTRSSSTYSKSSASVDLMRDIDDEVPQWVRQQEARHQHQLVQCHQQRGGTALAPCAIMEGKTTTLSLKSERAEMLRPFIGKPTLFCPSCAASRKTQNNTGIAEVTTNDGSRFTRCSSTNTATARVATADTSLFVSAAKAAASTFLAGWKEGKRLLKQNPTAVSIVQYLCSCFEQWKPCGRELQTQTRQRTTSPSDMIADEENHSLEVSISSEEDQAEKSCNSAQNRKNRRNSSIKVATIGWDTNHKDYGVELKIRVQYVEAAFNVAVVHGSLVWCSKDARQRLHLGSETPSPSQNQTRRAEMEEEEGDSAAWNNMLARSPRTVQNALVSQEEDFPWTFLFPEAALMRMKMTIGEHLYLAHPYYVYADQRVVLASYNFTTDAVVHEQVVQFEQEMEERLHAVSHLNDRNAADTAFISANAPSSIVRSHALPRTSHTDCSLTNLDRSFSTTVSANVVHSSNRVLYETPSNSRTPQRSAQTLIQATPRPEVNAAARTPELAHNAALMGEEGTSPEPHPPLSNQHNPHYSEHPAKAGALLNEKLDGDRATAIEGTHLRSWISVCHTNDSDYEDANPNPSLSLHDPQQQPLPPYVRACTASVNSLAADGFYDPLAMPAFRTTATTAMTTAGAAASTHCDGDSTTTIALTGNSVNAEKDAMYVPQHYKTEVQSSGVWETAPQADNNTDEWRSRWLTTTASGVGSAAEDFSEHALRQPSPYNSLNDGTNAQNAQVSIDPSKTADARPAINANPVHTFGSADAVVEDHIGYGFPRGPPPSWDVPVEILRVLSGVSSQLVSTALTDSRHSRGTQQVKNTGNPTPISSKRAEDAGSLEDITSQCFLSTQHKEHRKRDRDDTNATTVDRDAPIVHINVHTGSLSMQAVAAQQNPLTEPNEAPLFPDVSYSFPTPLPSLTQQRQQQPILQVAVSVNGDDDDLDSLSCSISSPSDLNDADAVNDTASSVNARPDTPTNRFPTLHKAPSRRSGVCRSRGSGVQWEQRQHDQQQKEQQHQQQDVWMRRLWQQPAETTSTPIASVVPPSQNRSTASRIPVPLTHSQAQPMEGKASHGNDDCLPSQMSASIKGGASACSAGGFGPVVNPHETEQEASSATTGFYLLCDVTLSDIDE